MAERTKRIFISDVHMGDDQGKGSDHPYCWFTKNNRLLAQFLEEKRTAQDVKEVVILGDLFDNWVIPATLNPLTSFDSICTNEANQDVIDKLKALAAKDCPVKLAYVPGNHDMAITPDDMAPMRQFFEKTFPDIRFISDAKIPVGTYNVGTITAEHGHRFAMFNSPDTWTHPGKSFLPLGYFITRMITYKVFNEGKEKNYFDMLYYYIRNHREDEGFIEAMMKAVAKDAKLDTAEVNTKNLAGFNEKTSVASIGADYKDLAKYWQNAKGTINAATAVESDCDNLDLAARDYYRKHGSQNSQHIVIFGHTHTPTMLRYELGPVPDNPNHDNETPWDDIYANCGAWCDDNNGVCTYVETEEAPKQKRHYVRLMQYKGPGDAFQMKEGFVAM
jgi:UDP-2,3-diacylglucosamine pyrophosphatase LpxH